eukprot:COSAG01_NODE_2612_length_7381_cov_11.186762_9_plen_128_part_00
MSQPVASGCADGCWAECGNAQPGGQARSAVQGTSEVDLCFQRMILDTPPCLVDLDRTQFAGRPNPLRQPASEHDTVPRNFGVSANTAKTAGRPAELLWLARRGLLSLHTAVAQLPCAMVLCAAVHPC